MLEAIRNATKTWIAKVILALITIPFALWGIESYIAAPPAQNVIATVGGEKINSAEFNDAVRGQLEQYKRQFGPGIDASIMDNPQLRQAILDQLIDQRLFAKASQVTGVKVSDAALRDRIALRLRDHDALGGDGLGDHLGQLVAQLVAIESRDLLEVEPIDDPVVEPVHEPGELLRSGLDRARLHGGGTVAAQAIDELHRFPPNKVRIRPPSPPWGSRAGVALSPNPADLRPVVSQVMSCSFCTSYLR